MNSPSIEARAIATLLPLFGLGGLILVCLVLMPFVTW